MRSKLAGLALVTLLVILGIVPFKTHAVKIELSDKSWSAQLSLFSPSEIFHSIYFTPITIASIIAVLAIAGYFAVRIVRAR